MKKLILSLFVGLSLATNALWAQLTVTIRTGGDDLRGGQAAYIQLIYKNNTVSQEFDLNGGGGWGNNSTHTKSFQMQSVPNITDIASVRIRYDGSSRKFPDTYDNWNVDLLSVSLNGTKIAECSGTPWHRFTGESATRDCKTSVSSTTASFAGCWDSDWTDRNSKGKIAGGTKISFKQDVRNRQIWQGAWTGTADDADGFRHCGFLYGTLTGNTLVGAWYEVIYKNPTTCPVLTYSGTFRFTLEGNKSFKGT